jgi:hypothetical protein
MFTDRSSSLNLESAPDQAPLALGYRTALAQST